MLRKGRVLCSLMTEDRIRWKEAAAYAVGDTASCLYYNTFNVFLMFFYTDTYGLAPAALGAMLLITRIWDTLLDPVMGMVADRTRSRWGQFRPWLLWMAVPYGIAGVMTFVTPDFSPSGKLLYAYVTYTLVMMVYTAINIPYGALLGVITRHSEERTRLSSFRFLGAFAGNLIVQGSLLYLVKTLGHGNDRRGYPLAMGIYALAAIGLFLLTFSYTRERVRPPKSQRTNIRQDLADLAYNRPWIVLCATGIICLTWICIRQACTVYYFKYFAGSEGMASSFMVCGTLATLAGVACTSKLTRWLGGKKRAYIMYNLANAGANAALYLAGPSDFALMYATQILGSFFIGPILPLTWAMYADAADYGEWKNGRRATGLCFSAATFSQKIGWTIGSALAAWMLAFCGFQANAAQTPATLRGIQMMMSIIPGAACLLTAGGALFYNLDGDTQRAIEADLLKREHAQGANCEKTT
jgi:GPH family glycoside/pentoside/hexuronide:cation symporter